jgi:hypothetical protein
MKKEKTMHRRRFLRLAGGATALSLGLTRSGSHLVYAQEGSKLANLGLPELTVTVTDTAYEISPAEIPAGWTLMTLVNQQSAGDTGADVFKLPEGQSAEDFLEGIAEITGAPPAEIYESLFAGSPWTAAGTSAQAVVNFSTGEWLLFAGPEPLTPAVLTVTEGAGTPAAPPDLTADLDVTLKEFTFEGLGEGVSAGPQIWKVTNTGEQPHLMIFSPLPPGTTQEQFMEMVMAEPSGTPEAEASPPPGPPAAGGCGTISAGQSLYLALDLAAGTYGAICFFPDQQTGAPHLAMGMALVFTVA